MSGTTVTVPGAQGTSITETYGNPNSLFYAQSIASVLNGALASSLLTVQDYTDQIAVPAGNIGELAVTTPGGADVAVGPGYTYVAVDHTVTGPVTVSGAANLFAGDQDITYYGASGPDQIVLTLEDGNSLISLPTGSSAIVSLGSGSDTVFANGINTTIFTGFGGSSLVFSDSPDNTGISSNYILAQGAADTIVAGQGQTIIQIGNAQGFIDPLIFGGEGQTSVYGSDAQATIMGGTGTLVFLGQSGPVTVFGGAGGGTETLFGGATGSITYEDGASTVPGAAILAGPSFYETLGRAAFTTASAADTLPTMDASGAHIGVQMAVGDVDEVLLGSQGDDIFYGGFGLATITGNGGLDAYIFGSDPDHAGGSTTITDWTSSDNFVVVGYGETAAQDALDSSTVTDSGLVATLSDGTTITFQNVTDPTQIHNQSFLS